jgi:Flp pilus assembly protein TadG
VEAALLLPILITMMLGIVEMSLYMRDIVSVSSAVRVGSRIASVSAGAGPGTCVASVNPPPCTPASAPAFAQAAANAIQRAGSAMPQTQINSLTIYDANAKGYPQPANNTALTCSYNCVVYVWDTGLGAFRYASGSWNSTSVNACVNDPNETAIGIAMTATHPWITGFFKNSVTINERSVMQFEPLPSAGCLPGAHL